ncbi:MAG: cyclase family protein [Gammaproteobacteria bacterium]|nr:MAG: cyclase family protein [Gammaproteobacteria bacterium TMED236]
MYKLIFFCIGLSSTLVHSSDLSTQRGMTNILGLETWSRCSELISNPKSNSYELSYLRTHSMPLSPFAGQYKPKFLPPSSMPDTVQVFTMDVLNENVNDGNQGTQMDALGHFGHLDAPWDGKSELDMSNATFFGGLNGKDVKPSSDSPLLKLGMETVPPIITSAVLIDVKKYAFEGQSMSAGEYVTVQDIKKSIAASSLKTRGIIEGDVVLIYTGWSDNYQDPDESKLYYSMAPGISYKLAKYLASKKVVAVGLDTPFVDALADPKNPVPIPEGTPENMLFPVHHYFLTQAGVHTLENFNLKKISDDSVELSCVMILPLMVKGSSASSIRPVAIGPSSL